jgi:DNA-binding CsgD family transcriptional regulator
MARLTARDYEAALDFLRVAGDAGGADAFPEPVLERLRLLVGCDCVSYGEYAGLTVRRRNIRAAPADVLPVSPDLARETDRLRHHSPLLPRPSTVGRPVRLSDCLTRRERDANPLCRLAKSVGIDDSMDLWLVDGGRIVVGFGFDSSGRDFTTRDKAVLEALVPHLVQLRRAALARRPCDAESDAAEALTVREREILRLVAHGLSNAEIAQRLVISPLTAKTHVSRIMGKLGARDRAQLVIVAYESGMVTPGSL